MEFFDGFQLFNVDVGDLDVSPLLVLMHPMPMNATTMVEIFHEIIGDLPLVFNMLQESETPSNEPITMPDNVEPTVNVNAPSFEGGIDNIALQFANNHLSRISYCLLLYCLKSLSEYEGMVHKGRVIFKDGCNTHLIHWHSGMRNNVAMATYTFAFLKNPPPTQQILYAPWQCPDGYARVVLSQLTEYPSITSHVLTGDDHLQQLNELEADELDIEDDGPAFILPALSDDNRDDDTNDDQ
ncbi:hypothetical protein EDC04DRAFT_2615954 [Pisolithus marmoratus]|nr:hypothetical protein EDC04DRAFT_2615954 [Pisolithus marmoratus]